VTLDPVAVEAFTRGRLNRDDPDTQRQLEVALAAARHWCGWHVTPVREMTLTIDGPGGKLLVLPTLFVKRIQGIAELGVPMDLGDITWSKNGRVAKRDATPWTDEFQGIEVTFTHGYDSAIDFENVILAAVDRGHATASSGSIKAIGPFQYNSTFGAEAGPSFMEQEVSVLDRYRLEKPA